MSGPLLGPTNPISPGHSQVLQGVLVETVVIIGIRCYLIRDCIPIHRRRHRNVLGSPLHFALRTPLNELNSRRTWRTPRFDDHLLQRNQGSDWIMQWSQDRRIGALHLYRTGRPTVTGGKGWCPDPVHCKYIVRKWTKNLANTHPEYFKDIQNFLSQFNWNFPSSENTWDFTVYPGDFLIRKYVEKFKMYPRNVPTVFLGGSFKVFFAMSQVK